MWEIFPSFIHLLVSYFETPSSQKDGKILHVCVDSFHRLAVLCWLASHCTSVFRFQLLLLLSCLEKIKG